jgi:carboxymethylenebutenolidase
MASRWIDIHSKDDKTFKGYLSLPPTGSGPGIVLIQEIFGVNSHIQAIADQYALDGFVVLAPDLFWRMQPRVNLGYAGSELATAMGYMQKMDFPLAVQDLAVTVSTLRGLTECTGKVASLGYCMGGTLSYLSAANAGVDAAVCYYPGGIHAQLGQAAKVTCPILFQFAENDKLISADAVEAVKATFSGKSDAQVEVYPHVEHGFNCWERPAYDQKTAVLAHGRTLSFLSSALL